VFSVAVPILLSKKELFPEYALPGCSGVDLKADLEESLIIEPFQRVLIPTGISIHLPEGYEAQVRPRSGLALKHGLTVLNSPGTIDTSYRGEIKVLLIHLGQEPVTIDPHMRIAQLVVAPFAHAVLTVVTELSSSERNERGFGSTGVK
jgi:dUTP pyrophosphatase